MCARVCVLSADTSSSHRLPNCFFNALPCSRANGITLNKHQIFIWLHWFSYNNNNNSNNMPKVCALLCYDHLGHTHTHHSYLVLLWFSSVELHSNFDICKWHSPNFIIVIIIINTDISVHQKITLSFIKSVNVAELFFHVECHIAIYVRNMRVHTIHIYALLTWNTAAIHCHCSFFHR